MYYSGYKVCQNDGNSQCGKCKQNFKFKGVKYVESGEIYEPNEKYSR